MRHVAPHSPTGRDARILRRRMCCAFVLALAGAVATTPAHADGRYCSSRDAVQFGNRALGTSTSASVTISNCGDAPWSFTDVSVHPATAPAFRVSTACATGLVLAPGRSCTIGVEFAPQTPGQVSGAVWLHNSTAFPTSW